MEPVRRRAVLRAGGFTLTELLVIVLVMAVVAAFSVPAVTKVLGSVSLTEGGKIVSDQLGLARQLALTRNAPVEFRLYQLPEEGAAPGAGPAVYRGCQIFTVPVDEGEAAPLTKPVLLPGGIVLLSLPAASSLLAAGASASPSLMSGSSSGARFAGYEAGAYNYLAFHFNADGGTDLSPNATWFLTLGQKQDLARSGNGVPANFVTIQIDPVNGRTRSFRP